VLRPAQYYSLLRLLEVFSEHLAAACEGLMLRAKPAEPAAVTKAREFIAVHHPEPLSLARVSRAVSVSATYFSRRFKETAGMTFIDYLARVRVEKAKSLLQNPGLRISEIALDAGYQSLSQFNRSFKKITGWPPTEFRARL
jgi:AraC-like DNA-binding protein